MSLEMISITTVNNKLAA